MKNYPFKDKRVYPAGKRDVAEAIVTTLLCALATELFHAGKCLIEKQLAKRQMQGRQVHTDYGHTTPPQSETYS